MGYLGAQRYVHDWSKILKLYLDLLESLKESESVMAKQHGT